MGMHQKLSKQLIRFIEAQHLFFVATAADGGRINLSPKGLESMKILSEKRLLWLNLTGSGNETAAHLLQNPRITLMWCSFDKKPLILRVYGIARCVHPGDKAWEALSAHFPDNKGARQVVDVAIESVQNSCGYGVPKMQFESLRSDLDDWSNEAGDSGIRDYWEKENLASIDGFETGMREVLSKSNYDR